MLTVLAISLVGFTIGESRWYLCPTKGERLSWNWFRLLLIYGPSQTLNLMVNFDYSGKGQEFNLDHLCENLCGQRVLT